MQLLDQVVDRLPLIPLWSSARFLQPVTQVFQSARQFTELGKAEGTGRAGKPVCQQPEMCQGLDRGTIGECGVDYCGRLRELLHTCRQPLCEGLAQLFQLLLGLD
jgi:hypothetical protein